MKIAIISDIHENFHNLILSLQEAEKQGVTQIFCLGDLINPGIAKVLATQSIPVQMIWGNNDGDRVEIVHASYLPDSVLDLATKTYQFLEIGGKRIFLTHYEDLAIPMSRSGLYDAVFYGHNHEKKIFKEGNCWVVNPGELAASKTGEATFAIYNTEEDTIELITLQGSVTLKTPLMQEYLAKNAHKMNLRSGKAFGIEK